MNGMHGEGMRRLVKGVAGLVVMICGLVWLATEGEFGGGWVDAPGKVIQVVPQSRSYRTFEVRSYHVFFEFKDERARRHEVTTRWAMPWYARFTPGQAITVLYDPKHPEAAKLKTFDALYLWPVLTCAVGFGLLVSSFLRKN